MAKGRLADCRADVTLYPAAVSQSKREGRKLVNYP